MVIKDFKLLAKQKGLKRFVGMIAFNVRWIKGTAQIMKLIYDILQNRDDKPVPWNNDALELAIIIGWNFAF